MANLNKKTVILVGHAAFPQGMAAKGLYDHLSIVAEVDRVYGVIVDVECNLITDLANGFVRNLLQGYCLKDGIDDLVSEVFSSYRGAAKNAIIAAIKDLHREFIRYNEKNNFRPTS
jgi:hypothetical protein